MKLASLFVIVATAAAPPIPGRRSAPERRLTASSAAVGVAGNPTVPSAGQAAPLHDYLADNTVLIVRHAEKPPEGTGDTGLTEAGRHRAEAYTTYFQPFHENGQSLRITALYAGADSTGSNRPRLTLEPLSRATGLPLNTTVSTKDPAALIALLQSTPHGKTPLICWRHGQIPALLTAFGVAPETLLPNGKWPDDVFDWVIVLHLDAAGKVMQQELVHETLNAQ